MPSLNELRDLGIICFPPPTWCPTEAGSGPPVLLDSLYPIMAHEPASPSTLLHVFYGLQTAGLVGAVGMLFTALVWREAVRRHASWFNFMATWIISCCSYIFLIGMPPNQQPNHLLCLVQATLIYSVPTLTSGATIALVIHVYITLRCRLNGIAYRSAWTVALVCLPYIPAWAMFFFSLRIGLGDPTLVQRPHSSMYCNMPRTDMPKRVSSIVVATIMIICLGVEAVIFRNLRRAWSTLKWDGPNSVSMIVRVLAFTMVGMLTITCVFNLLPFGPGQSRFFYSVSLIFCAFPAAQEGAAFDVVISILPISSILIFGTQKDIFTAWGSICRRTPHGADTWETFTPLGTSLRDRETAGG
ncbi:hypothetical protein B0H17DRAFT_430733 [Mycena rosella]|uniref:Uncharacterized protein n=1 Tax=Mycena rosella TaxID=1033263 RepID=A0AAD7GKL7_MYCRO|nr:hypothetical protein B0H17DRAFT_430733 [Mycena rosella]